MRLDGGATIGRAYDNSICIDDSRVSRYHAVIEERGDGFYLDDLGSSNGTTVNGEPVSARRRLEDGDVISIGGAGTVEYFIGERRPASEGNGTGPVAVSPSPSAQEDRRGSPPIGLTLAVVGGTLAAIAGVVLLVTYLTGGGSESSVRIVSPQTGTTIRGPEIIRVDAKKNADVRRVIYLLNGVEFASAEFPPYNVTLDPASLQARFGNLGSGNSILTITVEDEDGNRVAQSDTVILSFNLSSKDPEQNLGELLNDGGGAAPTAPPPAGGVDTSALSRTLATQISGKSLYVFDGEFAEQIRLRTEEYRVDVMDSAAQHRRQISNAFGSQGVSVPLGFVLAISQSKFRDAGSDSGQSIGFWRVPRRVAVEQGYISAGDSAATLSDPQRSAEIAAQYTKDLLNIFGPDGFMFAIACYGMPIGQAAELHAKLEAADPGAAVRKDFWSLVRSGVVPRDGADRVVRFFAAGIVADNPRAFGLSARPLSTLY